MVKPELQNSLEAETYYIFSSFKNMIKELYRWIPWPMRRGSKPLKSHPTINQTEKYEKALIHSSNVDIGTELKK